MGCPRNVYNKFGIFPITYEELTALSPRIGSCGLSMLAGRHVVFPAGHGDVAREKRSMRATHCVGLVVLLSAAGVAGAQITQVDYGLLTGTGFEAFEGFAGGGAPGTNYDSPVSNASVTFGEAFVGQTVTPNGNFDVLSGNPTGPITVATGAANQNLCIFDNGLGNVITGLGPLGFPNFDAIGEGSLAFEFTDDQAEFGFQLVGGNFGNATVSFFQRDGTLLETIVIPNLADSFYGFTRDGGLQDIAGVSIHNDDLAGIGLDNLKFTIPTPSAALILSASALLATRRRR